LSPKRKKRIGSRRRQSRKEIEEDKIAMRELVDTSSIPSEQQKYNYLYSVFKE